MRVCVFDSGIGGIPFAVSLLNAFPSLELNYIADDAGFPYGTKSPEAIHDIVFERIRRVRARLDPEIIVISCLTAVQICLKDLQKAHRSLHILGVVPPLFEAAKVSTTRRIALFTTSRIAEDAYLDDIIARDAPDAEVMRVPAQDLVDYVEQQMPFTSFEADQAAVSPYVKYALDAGADCIVLASSQLVLLESALKSVLANGQQRNVYCLDSRLNMVETVRNLLRQDVENQTESTMPGFFLTSNKKASPSYMAWTQRFAFTTPQFL